LGSGVAVALESAVDDVGAVVVHVRHDGLVLRAIPSHVAGLSEPVAVHVLVGHVEHWLLSGLPLAVGVRHWGVLGQNAGHVPEEKVWVVGQGLCVKRMVVHHDGPVALEATTKSSNYEVNDPAIGQPATDIEVLNWQFTDHHETESATKLGSRCIVGPVEVGAIHGSGNFLHLALREPAAKNGKVVLCFVGPGGHPFFEIVLGETKADQFVVSNVV